MPGGFPQLTANANRALRRLPDGGAQLPLAAISGFIEQFTREFQIKDELPAALGPLELSSQGPYRAGEVVTIRETYTVGDMPMAVGGGIAVGQGRGGGLQTDDPAAAGYVTVTSSNPRCRLGPRPALGPSAQLRDTLSDRLPPQRRGTAQGRHRDAHVRRSQPEAAPA